MINATIYLGITTHREYINFIPYYLSHSRANIIVINTNYVIGRMSALQLTLKVETYSNKRLSFSSLLFYYYFRLASIVDVLTLMSRSM